ncbi:MAG: hypothetical protein E3J87_02135 [Candidatus Cloacimonadota bacterium]|nr:MAG: hypothetical protein E3J87_02135 [Candidatus Cloacimonadota bacterium]
MKQLKQVKQEITVKQETILRLNNNFNTLVDKFLLYQDIKKSSKRTYRKGLEGLFTQSVIKNLYVRKWHFTDIKRLLYCSLFF